MNRFAYKSLIQLIFTFNMKIFKPSNPLHTIVFNSKDASPYKLKIFQNWPNHLFTKVFRRVLPPLSSARRISSVSKQKLWSTGDTHILRIFEIQKPCFLSPCFNGQKLQNYSYHIIWAMRNWGINYFFTFAFKSNYGGSYFLLWYRRDSKTLLETSVNRWFGLSQKNSQPVGDEFFVTPFERSFE